MAIGILAVIALLSIVIGFLLFRLLTKNKIVITLFTLVFTIVILALALAYIIPNYNVWAYENAIKIKYPFIALLKEKSTDDYNAYMVKVKNDMHTNPSMVNNDTTTFVNDQLAKFSQHATNKSLCDYAKARIDFYKKTINTKPEYVLFIEFPKHFQGTFDERDLNNAIKDTVNTIFQAKGDVIASAINNPQPALSADDVQKAKTLLQQIGRDLAIKYGKDPVVLTFEHPESPSLDKTTGAAIVISLYEMITALSEEDCGLILKFNLLDQSNSGIQ